ncbi:MAG: Lrp/AsnC family transcriptional regulator [Myxococcota bacterium]|nr:AsnC family transcriptional regulator [Spirochaeta sp.]RPG07727.1 MAG: Lrp/AsnC family transcriptional regulator [Proteobacteria bacterium TMED72]
MKIDSTDHAILEALQERARISNVELADRVHLSESACLRRVRALEEAGVIAGYSAMVDPVRVGLPSAVFVQLTLQRQDQTDLDAFEEAVQNIPEVMECYLMTGEFDYLLRIVVSDASDYERVHRQHLTRLPGVARVQSSFTLRTVRKANVLPIR